MQPSPDKPGPKPNVPPRPENPTKPASAGPKQSKPPGGPVSRVTEATQIFEDTGADSAAKPATNRPVIKDTDAAALGTTDVFHDAPPAPHTKAAAKAAAAAPARPAAKPQPAENLDATELFSDVQGAAARSAQAKPTAPKVANTAAMDATGEFADADESPAPQRPAASAPKSQSKSQPQAATSEQELGVFGDFQLTKKLGEGGMGAVYKAQQISMDRPVALKIMAKKITENQTFVQRFYREARTQAKLDHPNIVRGYAVGELEGQYFFAMEFVDGASMQNWMNKHGKLSVGDAVHVTLCCAAALQHAHEQKLIHRDIKPDNILVTSKGVVKVADLGLAKRTDDDLSLTRTGTGLGTAYYMPLEQYKDAKRVDGRADIYALGVMLYYFLTGDLPFKGNTHMEVVEAKTHAKYKPARQLNPEVPERLGLMLDKMIAKEPSHRYQTCADIIKDLDSLGLASEYLTFVGAPAGSAARLTIGTAAPKSKSAVAESTGDDRPEKELWVLAYTDATGKRLKKQVSTGRLRQLIERGEVDPETAQASRYGQKQLRPLTSFGEFESLVRRQTAKSKSDRMSQKLENAYAKTARAEWRRQLFQKVGNSLRTFASYIFMIAVFVGVVIGGLLVYKNWDWLFSKGQELIPKAQELIPKGTGAQPTTPTGAQPAAPPGTPATPPAAAQPRSP